MSFIRCLSNPESMYVWSDGIRVNISHGVEKPHSSGRDFVIPDRTFRTCCKKWLGEYYPVRHHGMRVEEFAVDKKTAEIIPDWKPCPKCKKITKNSWVQCPRCREKMWIDIRRGTWVARLSYGKDFVDMWPVTWAYIAEHEREG